MYMYVQCTYTYMYMYVVLCVCVYSFSYYILINHSILVRKRKRHGDEPLDYLEVTLHVHVIRECGSNSLFRDDDGNFDF